MLEISKIQYAEKRSDTHPDATQITGGLSMHYALVVDNKTAVTMADIKDEIAERIWRKVYGDLNQPLMELQRLARHSVQPAHYDRVMQLCDQLNALLARKSPNDQAQ